MKRTNQHPTQQNKWHNPWRKSQRAVKLGLLGLVAALAVACGGGSGSAPGEVPNANNLAPANAKLLEISSAALGQITASWLPATDDATPAANLSYQLHASTDAAFTPSEATKVFEGKAVYQATVSSGLTAGGKYTIKLLVVDGQGASASSEGLNVTVSDTTATLNAGVDVVTLTDSQVNSVSGNQVTLQAGVANVQAGQFIASAQGTSGNGYLKKVESVTSSNGQTILLTRDASVNEVVRDIQLSSSFKMVSVPKEVTSTSQQAGLLRRMPTAQNPNQELAWAQTGFRYSTPNGTAQLQTGLPATWGQGLQAGLTQGAATDKQGSWGRLYMPGSVTIAEGETANFNIHSYIIEKGAGIFGDRRKICQVGFGAMKGVGDAAKPSAVSVVAGIGKINNQDEYRPTHIIYPATLQASAGAANPNSYTVDVTLYIEEMGQDCSNQTVWDEKVTLPLTIYVTNDSAALREKEKLTSAFTGTGDFKVTNDIDLSFQPTIRFDAVIADAKLSTARIQLDAAPLIEQTLRITASAEGSVNKTANILPVRKFYKVYVTSAGVPIVISGAYRIDMSIKGNVTGEIDATEKLTIGFDELSYGLEYVNGQYQVINKRQPVYRLSVGGKGKSQANLEITLQPSLVLSAYEAATGTVVLEPYLDAHAGVEGHVKLDTEVDFNALQVNMAADADYRLTKGTLGGGVRAKLGAELNVFDYTIAAWPAKGELKTYDLVAHTDFWSLPSLSAVVSTQTRHPDDSRAIAVKASAATVPNPLKAIFSGMDDTFVTWANWTNARIVPSLSVDASSYSILPYGAGPDTAWVVLNKPGTYVVRQGGYSSLGTWARQYTETTIGIKDDNSNGIPDWWEQRYGLTGSGAAIAAADADGDGLTNLQEWTAGSDPTVKNGDNDVAAINTSPSSATVGQTVELWVTTAWTAIKQVVWSFSDGLASLAATVADGISQKVNAVFTSTGSKTVTATFKDASGNVLGTQSQPLTVQPSISSNPSARIAGVIADSGSPTGAVPDQGTMSDNTPGLAGIVSAELTSMQSLLVYNGSTLLGTATVSGTSWTIQLPALADGTYVFKPVVYHAGTMTEGSSENNWTVTIKTASTGTSGKLPHTGITASQCYGAGSDVLMVCSGVADALNAQQDGHRASINPMGYSHVTKTGGGIYDKTECVKDDVTGLIWEGKTASGPRSGSNTYTNYHSSYFGTQSQMDDATNTYGYVAAVNAAALCGYTDWRLPTVDELQSIVDYSKPSPGPTINATWFPNTQANLNWSSSPYVGDSGYAWGVYFGVGSANYSGRNYSFAVRLVRASQ